MERFQRTRFLTVVVLAVVFGAGIMLGLGVVSLGEEPQSVATLDSDQTTPESGEGEGERERRPPMYEQVGALSAQQHGQIDSIVGARRFEIRGVYRGFRDRHDALHNDYDLEFRAILMRTREGIKSVMAPAQAVTYDSLIADYDRRREARRQEDGSQSRRK